MEKLGRECRELMVGELVEQFNKAPDFFVTSFAKLTVRDIGELREKLKGISDGYRVMKKSIVKQALSQGEAASLLKKDGALNETVESIKGTVGISFAGSDPFALSKILVNFAKEHPEFIVEGGLLEGQILSQNLVRELASLPSKEALWRKIVWTIKSPVDGFANALAGTLRGLLYAIKGIQEKLKTQN